MSRPSSSSSLPTFARNDSGYALLTRRGSESSQFGSRYIQVDDGGVYLSSLVVTVLVSAIATIGILLFTLVVTLSVMLGTCQGQPIALSSTKLHQSPVPCPAFIMNAEVNNYQGWVVAEECVEQVSKYMQSQYFVDFAGAISAAADYLTGLTVNGDGLDVIVMDIDETVLSNLPYYVTHNYGADTFDEDVWNEWVDQSKALPLHPSVALFKQLKSANIGVVFLTGRPETQRNTTSANLISAGFEGWTELLLRSPSEVGLKAVDYKSNRRLQLQLQGYRVLTSIGDQWSDLIGPAAGVEPSSFQILCITYTRQSILEHGMQSNNCPATASKSL